MSQNPNDNPYNNADYGKPQDGTENAGNNAPPYPSSAPSASPYSSAQPPTSNPYAAPPSYGTAEPPQHGYPGSAQGNMYAAPAGYNSPAATSTTGFNSENWKEPRNLSIIYGAGSLLMILLSFVVGFTGIFSLVLSPLAIVEAKKAKRMGQDATVGFVLGWIGIALIIVSILLILFMLVIFGAIFAGGFGY